MAQLARPAGVPYHVRSSWALVGSWEVFQGSSRAAWSGRGMRIEEYGGAGVRGPEVLLAGLLGVSFTSEIVGHASKGLAPTNHEIQKAGP